MKLVTKEKIKVSNKIWELLNLSDLFEIHEITEFIKTTIRNSDFDLVATESDIMLLHNKDNPDWFVVEWCYGNLK